MTFSDTLEETAYPLDELEDEPIVMWMSGNEEETSDFVQWWPY